MWMSYRGIREGAGRAAGRRAGGCCLTICLAVRARRRSGQLSRAPERYRLGERCWLGTPCVSCPWFSLMPPCRPLRGRAALRDQYRLFARCAVFRTSRDRATVIARTAAGSAAAVSLWLSGSNKGRLWFATRGKALTGMSTREDGMGGSRSTRRSLGERGEADLIVDDGWCRLSPRAARAPIRE